MTDRATITVASPPGSHRKEALVATCSEHGEFTDWWAPEAKHTLQLAAHRHAEEFHDGDVERIGWR